MISLQKSLLFFILCFTLPFIHTSCNSDLTFFNKVDLHIKVPQSFVSMNAEMFESHFLRQNLYCDSLIMIRKQYIEQLFVHPNHVFFQDTSNIFNNILIYTPPFVPMNKSNFKSVRTIMRSSLTKMFPYYEVRERESALKSGTYPYSKIIYQLNSPEEQFQLTYYIVTKKNDTKFIIINNTENKDFEEMVRYLE